MRTSLCDKSHSQTVRGITMDKSSEPVWILFVSDIESRDKLLKYSSGSQWEVDPVTAAALILVGAAVRMQTPAVAESIVDRPAS
jgi:hypothetical protein